MRKPTMKHPLPLFGKASVIACGLLSITPSSFATNTLDNQENICPKTLDLKSYADVLPDLAGKDHTSTLLTLKIKDQIYVGTISMGTKYKKSLKTFLKARIKGPSLKLDKGPTPLGRKMICEYTWGKPEERQILIKLSTLPRANRQGHAQKEARK